VLAYGGRAPVGAIGGVSTCAQPTGGLSTQRKAWGCARSEPVTCHAVFERPVVSFWVAARPELANVSVTDRGVFEHGVVAGVSDLTD
jgi:hypothetical protein